MGARGPAPKPTRLRVLEGNPSKRALPKNEPKPRPVVPKPPEWLDAIGLDFWKRNVTWLERTGVMTEADAEAFAALCTAFSRWRQAETLVDESPENWRAPIAAQNAARQYHQLLQQFGMTPASRTRVQVTADSPRDSIEDLLD